MPLDAFNSWADKARAVPIEREIERRGIKLRGGVDRCGPCPKCGGDDRFSINTAKQIFNCRGCGVGGDVIAFVEHIDGVDFEHACQTLTGEPKPNGRRYYPKIKQTTATYEYRDASGAVVYVIDRIEFQAGNGVFLLKNGKREKTFRQRRPDPDRPGNWISNVDGVPILPYRLPELLEAVAAECTILIVEGEAKVDLLRSWNVPATCCAGGAKKWKPEHAEYLRGADVVLLGDNDQASWEHTNQVGASLVGIAARTRVLMLPGLPPKGDIVDWAKAGGTREQLDALIEHAPGWQPVSAEAPADEAKAKATADEQKIIDACARLDAREYDRRREEAADQIGIRRGTLDGEVRARREALAEETGPLPLFGYWIVEPWPEPVETDALLLSISRRLQRHVVFSTEANLTATALWILFAWVHDIAAVHSPMLLVTSPEKNSGKTTLLDLIKFLTPNAMVCVGVTEAALFRGIELWDCTLIIDEADTILIDNEPLRAVINTGWTRGSGVPRCLGDEKVPHLFPTFCGKALGMKGKKLPDTTLSRTITIEMKPKRGSEKVERFRHIDDDGLRQLREQAKRWAADNGETLRDAGPDISGLNNRVSENWWMQFAIADLAGGEWPELARRAARKLSEAEEVSSISVRAIAAIQGIFDGRDRFELLTAKETPEQAEAIAATLRVDEFSSAELVERLAADASGPWAEWKAGKPITQAQLARVLKPLRIGPLLFRSKSGAVVRGYRRFQFEEAWDLYPMSSSEALS